MFVATSVSALCVLCITAIASMADMVMDSVSMAFGGHSLLSAVVTSVSALLLVFLMLFFVGVFAFCMILMYAYSKAVWTAVSMTITRIRWESKITDDMLKDVGRSRSRHMSMFAWSLVKNINDDIISLMGNCRIIINNSVTGESKTYRGIIRD